MLRIQFVCRVSDSHIQRCLLSEPKLTLKTAMQITLGMESAAQNARTLQGGGESSAATSGKVLRFTGAKPGSSSKQQMLSCTRCGKPAHPPSKCMFKDAQCHHWGKMGHLKPACLALKRVQTKL